MTTVTDGPSVGPAAHLPAAMYVHEWAFLGDDPLDAITVRRAREGNLWPARVGLHSKWQPPILYAAPGRCQVCQVELTGQRRKNCSDACRRRAAELRQEIHDLFEAVT